MRAISMLQDSGLGWKVVSAPRPAEPAVPRGDLSKVAKQHLLKRLAKTLAESSEGRC